MRPIHIETSSWDPAAKAYMMAYDKQLKDFATMYDGGYSLGRYEDLDPHGCISRRV